MHSYHTNLTCWSEVIFIKLFKTEQLKESYLRMQYVKLGNLKHG